MEATVEDALLTADADGLIAAVDGRRAEGLSVAAACRAVGVSTSTYYRRRRTEGERRALAVAAAPAVAPGWPFQSRTPRAPQYWDQAFADELSDSFVRREFGSGVRLRASGPLAALADPAPPWRSRLERLVRRAAAGPLGAVAGPFAAVTLIVALGAGGAWLAARAADPAAWVSDPPAVTRIAEAGGR